MWSQFIGSLMQGVVARHTYAQKEASRSGEFLQNHHSVAAVLLTLKLIGGARTPLSAEIGRHSAKDSLFCGVACHFIATKLVQNCSTHQMSE